MKKLTLLLLSLLLVCLAPFALAELKEAPMLAEQVAAGTLPPVEERMPVAEDILVVTPEDEVGQYGGDSSAVRLDPTLPGVGIQRARDQHFHGYSAYETSAASTA